MSKNYFATENVLEDFYLALVSKNPNKIPHLPRSDVHYVRAAIEAKTGVRYTLDHVERAMYVEGHLEAKDVLDPERVREHLGF